MYLAYDIIPYAFEHLVVFIIRGKKTRECHVFGRLCRPGLG